VNTIAQTCNHLHAAANDRLYGYFAERYSIRGLEKVVESGNVTAMRGLISAGASGRDGLSNQIRLAAAQGDLAMVRLLVQFGSSSPAEMKLHLKKPLLAAITAGHIDVLDYLLDIGVICLDFTHHELQQLLIAAAVDGHPSSVEHLVKRRGVPVDALGEGDATALWAAARCANLATVLCIVNLGANFTSHPPRIGGNISALLSAIMANPAKAQDYSKIVYCLLDRGLRPHLQDQRSFVMLAEMMLRGRMLGDMAISIWNHLDLNAVLETGKQNDSLLLYYVAIGDTHRAVQL
jgi:ankyrin repeat protein